MATNAIDQTYFSEIKDHAKQLKADMATRDSEFLTYENMYHMTWEGSGTAYDNVRYFISPDARNAVLGAVRLLVAADPIINVTSSDPKWRSGDNVEHALAAMWSNAGRAIGIPLHYDMVTSSVLYAEMHTAITLTSDLLERAKKSPGPDGKPNRGLIAAAELMAAKTPFLLESWNPKSGYPEFGRFGLSGYYRESKATVNQVIADFGELVPETFLKRKRYEQVNLYYFVDGQYSCYWVDDGAIMLEEHGLPVIPVDVTLTQGSRLFAKPEQQRQPLLYSLAKSSMWEHQNMMLSVMMTSIYDMGMTPLYVHRSPPGQPGKELDLDFSRSPGVVEVEQGEEFVAIGNKGIIDPAVSETLQMVNGKIEESTIYRTTMGEGMNNTSFSLANLVSQSGRLPLAETQKRGSWGIASVIEKMMIMYKNLGGSYRGAGITLKPADIPDDIQVDVKLEIKLPQDRLQLANIANILKSSGLADSKWIMENILNINETNEVQRGVWSDRASDAMFQSFLQQQIQLQMMQAQQAQMAQQGPPPGQPPMQQPPMEQPMQPPMEPQMPPETGAPEMAPDQGQMIRGGLPPQQAGMIPPGGQVGY